MQHKVLGIRCIHEQDTAGVASRSNALVEYLTCLTAAETMLRAARFSHLVERQCGLQSKDTSETKCAMWLPCQLELVNHWWYSQSHLGSSCSPHRPLSPSVTGWPPAQQGQAVIEGCHTSCTAFTVYQSMKMWQSFDMGGNSHSASQEHCSMSSSVHTWVHE